MTSNAVFIYSDDILSYKFSNNHPFNQLRVQLTYELLREFGALGNQDIVLPRMASMKNFSLSMILAIFKR